MYSHCISFSVAHAEENSDEAITHDCLPLSWDSSEKPVLRRSRWRKVARSANKKKLEPHLRANINNNDCHWWNLTVGRDGSSRKVVRFVAARDERRWLCNGSIQHGSAVQRSTTISILNETLISRSLIEYEKPSKEHLTLSLRAFAS